MTEKLKIYMSIAENSGVGYYREYLPAVALRELGLADVRINDFRWAEGDHKEPSEKVFYETCNWADIIIAGRMDRPEYYAKWGAVKEYFNIPIVLDTDDNIQHVRPSNPGFAGYQWGSEAQIWNQYAMSRIFDAITVTTEDLMNFYKKKHPKIYILPNSLDFKKWESFERKPHRDIRIAFVCSGAHAEGFGIILPSVYKILEKYPNTQFWYPEMFWRHLSTAPEKIKKQLKTFPWIKLKVWEKTMKEYGFDIGLAPLRDNMFNRGKSNLRYIEYTAAGMASVVSLVKPYMIVKNGETGFIAKDENGWYSAIEKLLEPEFRATIAKNAYEYAGKGFDIYKNACLWYNTYKEIQEKFHNFYGKKRHYVDMGRGKYREIGEYK